MGAKGLELRFGQAGEAGRDLGTKTAIVRARGRHPKPLQRQGLRLGFGPLGQAFWGARESTFRALRRTGRADPCSRTPLESDAYPSPSAARPGGPAVQCSQST